MKTIFRLTFTSLAIAIMTIAALPARGIADTTPQSMPVSCTAPNPDHQTGLRRPKGDGNIWTFQVVLQGGARFVSGPVWSYPGKSGVDPDWGLWTGGEDGDSSLGWSSPGKTGEFQVRVSGKIVCGDGPGDGEPIDFSAGWDGEVSFNAEIKVKRSGTPEEDYSGSATVAVGAKSTSEHKADVMVIATDDDGNPMEDVTVDTPTIQNGEGVETDASISAVNATTDAEGKAYFTFTSSDIVGSVSLEISGGESSASATISQNWTKELPNDDNWPTPPNDENFEYDMPSNITFKMVLDGNGTVPIAEHSIYFMTVAIAGFQWDSEIEYFVHIDGNSSQIDELVAYSTDTNPASENSPGNYSGSMTVNADDDFHVDSVAFEAVDYSAYEP